MNQSVSYKQNQPEMAQLPPKVPTSHQKLPFMPPSFFPLPTTMTAAAAATATNNLSWIDEFLEFSAARHGAHRHSVSDPVTFLEASSADEDQLIISMFSDDVPPSSPSDHDSFDDEKVVRVNVDDSNNSTAADEGESESKVEARTQEGAPASSAVEEKTEQLLDPKRVRRILANRQSAQRSRVRKLQYISELERRIATLHSEVSALAPRVAYFNHQRSVLTIRNNHLKQRIAALAQDRIFEDAHQEALKKEIERLRHVYHQQNQNSSTGNEKEPSLS